ncbi:glycerol-3-phosphate responsive antiterminator [Criibacterium bergeronii]|uniref:Glycerol-3-phosphate responsive antiterminator n=1 Tax=Criibacterium bergeronii TaxID=1871336 RepID=A0A552VB50_9FIRM|nr:glycerol-3-phosphate responsive antiterminator [Criibacterium bergeronii]TRW27713.1 glycerol-3-phosphate responsive antiterminator [Criibacterium bergeronii]
MKSDFIDRLYDNPVIMAIKNDEELEKCIDYDNEIVFLLYGDVCNIQDKVSQLKSKGKFVLVHTDLIQGLSNKEIAVDFVKKYTESDGIISTKENCTKRANEIGLCSVLRYFVLDSMSYSNVKSQIKNVHADAVEILPGNMPKVISNISKMSNKPIITGGLISSKDEVMLMLKSGAVAISSTNSDVWQV